VPKRKSGSTAVPSVVGHLLAGGAAGAEAVWQKDVEDRHTAAMAKSPVRKSIDDLRDFG